MSGVWMDDRHTCGADADHHTGNPGEPLTCPNYTTTDEGTKRMTITTYDQIEQGTESWHDARRGMLTASVIGRLITPKTVKPASNDESRGLVAQLAAERITGWTDPTYVNADMQRGIDEEPRARQHYSETRAPVTEVGFMVLERDGFRLGFSPDGLVGDAGLIEIKSPRAKRHVATIVNRQVPSDNFAQIQAGLFVTGREWCDFVSWCGGLPMFVQRVAPDQRWFDAIEEVGKRCEEDITRIVQDFEVATHGLPTTTRSLADMEIF